jgi:leucyl-tRNA---protein transferase
MNDDAFETSVEPCPYLEGRTARLPTRLPHTWLTPDEVDVRLAAGERRAGMLWYHPDCPGCHACESLRLDTERYAPGPNGRRLLARGRRRFTLDVGTPVADDERVTLHDRHLAARGLARPGATPLDLASYRSFFVATSCDTVELSYRHEGRLAMVSLVDVGHEALSAVYCYFDPALSRFSPGTYSILREWELCRATGRRYLYLGYYVAGSRHMRYKARFLPHERLIDGVWRGFESD